MQDIKDFEPLWGEWRSVEILGQGTFGRVYKMVKKDLDQEYHAAVKHLSLPREPGEEKELYTEGLVSDQDTLKTYYDNVLKDLHSEIDLCYKLKGITNIVSYEDHYIRPKSSGVGYDIFIKMELLTGLQDRIKEGGLTIWDVVKLGEDICKALTVLRRERIIHRDIKPGNIFINSGGDYKLGDFGVSRSMERTVSNMSVKGTFSYMAPEVAKGIVGDYRVDTYSLGLVLYRMLNKNRGPFLPPPPEIVKHEMNMTAQERRLKGEPLPPPADADGALSGIILKACAYRPEDRWESAEEMGRALAEYRLSVNRPEPVSKTPGPESIVPSSEQMKAVAEAEDLTEILPQGVVTESRPAEEYTQVLVHAAPLEGKLPQPQAPDELPQEELTAPLQVEKVTESPSQPLQNSTSQPKAERTGGETAALLGDAVGKIKPPMIAAAGAVVLAGVIGVFALTPRPTDSPSSSKSDISSGFQSSSVSNQPEDNTPEPILWQDPFIRDGVLTALNTDEETLTPEMLAGLEELLLPAPVPDPQGESSSQEESEPVRVTTLADLSLLTGLKALDLSGHPVDKFDFPEEMSALDTLKIAHCGCTDLEFLTQTSFENLRILDLSKNEIADLAPLTGLSGLTELNISQTAAQSLEPLSDLSSLTVLFAADIPAEDWSFVEHIDQVEGRPEETPTPAPNSKPNQNSKPSKQTTDVTSVSVSPSNIMLEVGGSARLSASVSPANAANQKVSWSSSNPSVATVDGNGNVRAVDRGTARITASCDGKSGSCTITVD